MGAAGAYVGYKTGRAAAIVWAPVEAVGEKYARAKVSKIQSVENKFFCFSLF